MNQNFKTKHIEIEAVQFLRKQMHELLIFLGTAVVCYLGEDDWEIHTRRGSMKVKEGAWIVKGNNDEFYSLSPTFFEHTYEQKKPINPEELFSPSSRKSIKCPQCGRTSYNYNDVFHKYCGACHQFHNDM